MGTGTFFSQLAGSPLFRAMGLPGSNKYTQQLASREAGTSAANGGPYSGVTPTLAGANAQYAPGGPGANTQWKPWVAPNLGGAFYNFNNATQAPGGVPLTAPISGPPGLAGTIGGAASKGF